MGIVDNILIKFPLWSIRKAFRILLHALTGALLLSIVTFVLYIKSLPPLSTWHTTILKNEFTADSEVKDFDTYRALEDRLFTELDTEVYDKVLPEDKNIFNRYSRDSLSDPRRWDKEWNKSFELPAKDPKMGVLLLHGMSDSPYSLHAQAEYLQKLGVWVVSMRLPGHGTIPSGLRNIKWEDMATVVKIGMKRLNEKLGDKPIHIMGYSTGASLALNYTLSALNDTTLTVPSSLIFYSPAIGVTKAAPLAIWQSRIGHFFHLPKLEWNSISPEYDPYKYNSFAVNAGDQVYRVCNEVQKKLDVYLTNEKHKKPFPPVLSFASIIDSTVTVSDTVHKFYERLPKGDHTLVLFDINHKFKSYNLVKANVSDSIQKLRDIPANPNYRFDLISDMNSIDGYPMQITNNKITRKLDLSWPRDIYSLSHLAIPISHHDPLYGDRDAPKSPGIQLGYLAMYGETSVLQTSAGSLLRQRWNPFHLYIEQRVLEFMGLNQ